MDNFLSKQNESNNKVVLICVYIGEIPFWMPAFLLTCRLNPDVQWFIYSDMPAPPNCPDNVRFIPIDLLSFNIRASEALGLKICIEAKFIYKIVDLKPAYGKIFEKDIRSFSFWGHCDLDIVWGDISKNLGQEIFDNYDIITSRLKRISGHFCLFRNVPEINSTYKWIPKVFRMMQDTNLHAIDEGHITDYLHVHNNPNWVVRLKQAILGKQAVRPRVYWEKILTTSGAHQQSIDDGSERCWWWRNGKTYDADGNEMMYLHFHKIKQTMTEINFGYDDRPSEFMINSKGIFAP